MIISSSCIGMDSVRTYSSVRMDASTTRGGISNHFPNSFKDAKLLSNNEDGKKADSEKPHAEEKSNYDALSETLDDIRSKYDFLKVNNSLSSKLEQDSISRIRSQCLQYLLRMLLGHKGVLDENAPSWNNYSYSTGNSNVSFDNGYTTITESYTYAHFYEENEETCFSTTGNVITADGREINFNLDISMSRSFSEYYENTFEHKTFLCDPLVINLGSNVAEVSDVKFRFDLDADGIDDSVSTISSNSGFLALDLNEDGEINDGSELFGTKSGDGFKDLAMYDSDGNGWIDEADDVFNKLKIFIISEDGSRSLVSLKDKDIGAIYLGNVSTDFSMNSLKNNETNGVIRSTGVFLYENGSVGSIQHVDLAKSEYSA